MSKCTECGKRIRPVVSVDIDGTLGDYHGHFRSFAEQYIGRRMPAEFDGGTEYSDYLGLNKPLYREMKLAYRQGGQKRSMPIFTGAEGFMRDLQRGGFEVWIATTRPWQRLDNIDPDTRFWLKRHNIPYDYIIYGEDKYQELTERIDRERVVAVVEDLLPLCWDAMRQLRIDPADIQPERWPVIQPSFPHNSGMQFGNRVKPYSNIFTEIWHNKAVWETRYAA